MFSRFLTEVVSLEKADGQIFEGVKAGVQPKMILVTDVSLPIEEGDKIYRLLPSGVKETLIVTDPGYAAGLGGIKAHYQIKYRKEGITTPKTSAQSVVYNLTGANARVNIHSNDSSTNISNQNSDKIFGEIRQILATAITNQEERKALLARVDDLESSCGTSSFLQKYQQFMVQAANHMTVLAPVLPALATLIPS